MTTHLTARLAWHADGWDGSICKEPERNTYCVGAKSYPGDMIAKGRDLEFEKCHSGCKALDVSDEYIPPCCYSYNAFGSGDAPAGSNPPDFFFGGAKRHEWVMEPATVCVWPYDAMYADNVKADGYLDNDQRQQNTLPFFDAIERGENGGSLIFYYANYSNPLSKEEAQRYVVIGVSRVIEVADQRYYEDVNEQIAERFADGMIWAREVTSAFPDEGVRIPYHHYRDDPDTMSQLAVYPENPSLFKMGSRHISDDDAIGLLEQILARVQWLKSIGDQSENWDARADWLSAQIGRLWKSRGLYPGLLRSLETFGAEVLVPPTKALCEVEGHAEAHAAAFDALENGADNVVSAGLTDRERSKLRRSWALRNDDAKRLLREVFPRLDLDTATFENILNDGRIANGITASLGELAENPYILSEQYSGEDTTDTISWSAVDRGVLPSPELGPPLAEVDFNDERRFRGLLVDHLKFEQSHTFRFARDLLAEISTRMELLPEWKQASFSDQYFEVDREFLSKAMFLKEQDESLAVYLRDVYEDERALERTFRDLSSRPPISLKRPVLEADWLHWIRQPDSLLAQASSGEYDAAVEEQIGICRQLIVQPVSAVTGPAGTGKTTVIEALCRAVRKIEGDGASILVLAPTGKATDRIRQVFADKELLGIGTSTVHSLLASQGWLNQNMTFKRSGGTRSEPTTLIVDEASMLDLSLAAALARAIDWRHVRRLILVGDAGQIPPIGRGRIYADVLAWLKQEDPQKLGRLQINIRQMLTRIKEEGQSVVELSKLFVPSTFDTIEPGYDEDASFEGATTPAQEALIERLHEGGPIDRDLDVVYWNDPTELPDILIQTIERRMGASLDDERAPYEIWRDAMDGDPTSYQVLTPHRGELHGVEALNHVCQQRLGSYVISKVGTVDGITLFDKVIQVRNRPTSNPLTAYDWNERALKRVEVFNGEIGTVGICGFDKKVLGRLKSGFGPMLKRFAVRFARKDHLAVNYGKDVQALKRNGEKYTKKKESIEGNLELAYAISIHKAQGSEFSYTFVIVPASKGGSLSTELLYTAITRASRHCTLLIENDVSSLLDARRRENARTPQINSSLFEFRAAPPALINKRGWYEAGKIHEALSGDMVRSKSEVIIANMFHERSVAFRYEIPLLAPDGTLKLPDFTLTHNGQTYFWEHLGMLDDVEYSEQWKLKQVWYEKWFSGQLLTTTEGKELSRRVSEMIDGLA